MRVALAQSDPVGHAKRDCEAACSVIEALTDADLVLFPELFVGGYNTDDPGSVAIEVEDPALATVFEACRRSGCAAVIGFTELLEDGGFANSAVCVQSDGIPAGVYRKTHLFGPAERSAFVAGDELRVFTLAGRAIGPEICFDVEFPEPARLMATAGAEILVTISANMEPYAADHRLAARARALDNRLHHLYVNRTGRESGHTFTGESCVINPSGTVLAELGRDEGVLECVISPSQPDPDTSYLDQIRADLKVIVQHQVNGGDS